MVGGGSAVGSFCVAEGLVGEALLAASRAGRWASGFAGMPGESASVSPSACSSHRQLQLQSQPHIVRGSNGRRDVMSTAIT